MPPRGAPRGGRGGPPGAGNRGGGPAGGDARGGGPARGGPRGGPPRGGGGGGGDGGGGGPRGVGPRGVGPRGVGPRGGAPTRGAPAGGGVAAAIASSVSSVGVKRPGYGSMGRPLSIITNHFATDIPDSTIYHYDVSISSEKTLPPARCFEIVNIMQTQTAPTVFSPRGAYDGRKNLFSTARYAFGEQDTATFEVNPNPQSSSEPNATGRRPRTYHVTLKIANEINTETLHRYLEGKQSMDNTILTAITALNIAIRMAPSLIFPFNVRSFFTPDGRRDIGAGVTLWRGYFQSIRPGIGRMFTNIDISTGAMYKEGPLLELCLEVADRGMQNVNVLSPRHGLPDRERLRIQRFIQNVKVTTKHGKPLPPGTKRPPRVVRKLTKDGARDLTFTTETGASITVAAYFQSVLNRPLSHPDIVCAELATGAIIPLELCTVLPGQIIRKELPREKTKDVLAFSTKRPEERLQSIINGLAVLAYGQSEYVRQFGINVSATPLSMTARVIPPPTLKYGTNSRQATIQPRDGAWNMIDKKMYKPTDKIVEWVVVVYEQQRLFHQGRVDDMVRGLRQAANAVGVRMDRDPALVKYFSGQGNIVQQLVQTGGECREKTKMIPTLYVVIIPEHGNSDIYNQVKYFGDVKMGVVTQCMRAAKCMRANEQYYANVLLKLNVKQGGVNSIPDPRSVSFITDPANPTIIFGADAIHPAPGTSDRPSFTALVGNVDSSASKYVATMRAQETRKEIIQDLEAMVTVKISLVSIGNIISLLTSVEKKSQTPKRLIFYRDGVSEGEFKQVLEEELPQIQRACVKLKMNPKITLIVVGKRHHTRFFPANPNDGDRRSGNCPAGTVVDTQIVSPVEFDFFIQSHGGLLGTSRPAHYNVLYNENAQLNVDGLQSITHALTHVFARATRSVSIPAPVYYADIVCARAKHHYDPSGDAHLEDTTVDETNDGSVAQQARADNFRNRFQPVHRNISQLMYFC
ncbi:Piwi-domain-containing protein [Peniophora sp. CONT]|nr:Piwi-domain-containing protein [Peniophora sp. CONT]